MPGRAAAPASRCSHAERTAYTRTQSYFSNSELAARGRPGSAELALLAPFRDRLPEDVFTREFRPPGHDAAADRRHHLLDALEQLAGAGWVVRRTTRRRRPRAHGGRGAVRNPTSAGSD